MNFPLLRTTSVAVSLGAALALSGCGGGGGGTTVTPPVPPAAPVPTLAESLASSDNSFMPLSVAMRNDYSTDPDSVSLTDDFRVTSISSDGAGGWRVTYVLGGVEGVLHFGHGDKVEGEPGNFRIQTDEGHDLWFWSRRSRHVDEGTEQRYTYLDHVDGNVRFGEARDRYMLVYGNRTGTAGLPAGTALYTGWMYSRTQLEDNPGGSGRLDIDGPVRLIADFASSTLEGGVTGIRFRRYAPDGSRSGWEDIPATNRFAFENGRITGAQFMAELNGMDSGSNAPEDTVQGFEGTVNGEFYGPAAEEMAAVVSAVSAVHNRVLLGNFQSERLNPQTFEGARVPLSVGIERDYPTMQVQSTDTATVTSMEGDGAGGFHVTYQVDGTPQRVHLEASDYGSDPEFPYIYASDGPNSPYVLFFMSGSWTGIPEFNHFNTEGWVVAAYDANGDDENTRRGVMVYGNRTEVADLPSGTASYEGRMFAFGNPSDDPDSATGEFRIRSGLTLMADFANGDVTGSIHDIETRADPTSQYVSSTDELALSNGVITGNEFTADIAGAVSPGTVDADMTGRFFGPAAAEVGGVLSGEYTELGETIILHGLFGGEKQ